MLAAADHAGLSDRIDVLYDDYRTACLNRKYYGYRLHRTQTLNRWFEIAIAVGAAGTTIGGWAVWKAGAGLLAWGVISGLSVLLATVKPFAGFAENIERYSKLYAEYSNGWIALMGVVDEIKSTHGFAPELVGAWRKAKTSMSDLARDDDPNPDKKILQQLQLEVNQEIPVNSLWVPERKKARPQ